MRISRICGIAVTAAAVLLSGQRHLKAQSHPTSVAAASPESLRLWDSAIDGMARNGSLRVRRIDEDTLVAGRQIERLDQYYKGVRVHGGDVTRQTERGLTASIFGTIYEEISLDVTPRLTIEGAAAVIKRESGVDLGPAKLPQLLILPDDTGYRLVYHATAFSTDGGFEYFIDADTGNVIRVLDGLQRQSAIGTGTGVLDDRKKISASSFSGAFLADDALRPPALVTFDMKGNLARTLQFLNGVVALGASDYASDTDNVWADQAVVDAHAYAGYVYDYYYKRFGRRGLDNNDIELLSIVHPVRRDAVLSQPPAIQNQFYLNAGYYGDGLMIYGEGLPANLRAGGQSWNYLAGGLDIVGHELTHGVTDFTSELIYRNESGALNESFSDMIGTAIEFFYQSAGSGPLNADYLMGEDVITPGGIRSMENPAAYGQPDHYSRRLVAAPPTAANDNGGVHTNSGIGNHAYYLAIEGGTNRTSGLSVQGVGRANRDQIERVMYRGFAQLMPSNATYAVARVVTIQAARDLYGANSTAERAITQAWTAVGVN